MAIVKMSQFQLLAFEGDREKLLKELQKTGIVHFKNLSQIEDEVLTELDRLPAGEYASGSESELSKIAFALSKIEPFYKKPSARAPRRALTFEEFDSFVGTYDYNGAYESIKSIDEKIKTLGAEKNKLKTDNDSLLPWAALDIAPADLGASKSVLFFFGTLPRVSVDMFPGAITAEFPCVYIETLDCSREDATCFVITPTDQADGVLALAKQYGFAKVNLSVSQIPSDIISANNVRASEIDTELALCDKDLQELVSHYADLKTARDYFGTLLNRNKSAENFLKTKEVIAVAGWFANDDKDIFMQTVQSVCGENYYIETEDVDKDCTEVPVKLKNNRFVSAFEGVTEMYSMPRYGEIDPTPLLAPFYLLFFAMMFGDAGYGAVLAAAAALSLKFFSLKKNTRRFFKFFFYLGIATTAVGVLYGSLFGVTFFAPLDGRPILDLTGNIMFMLILSVALGVAQIMAGLIIKGYMLCRDGKILDAIFDSLFWILAVGSLVGLLASAALGAGSALGSVCGWILAGSLFGLALTQGRASKGLGGKIGNGLYSVYNITGYVGDFVSYTRIMAIALAGAYIAYSFNLMASLLVSNLGFLPLAIMQYIFAALVCVFGAALNMGLGALGAYVHTCRLQYVEYFSKFYEGGGVPFRAFGPKNTFVNISNINKTNIDGRH